MHINVKKSEIINENNGLPHMDPVAYTAADWNDNTVTNDNKEVLRIRSCSPLHETLNVSSPTREKITEMEFLKYKIDNCNFLAATDHSVMT